MRTVTTAAMRYLLVLYECIRTFQVAFLVCLCFFFFSSRRRHTRYWRDWSSDVCSSDLLGDVRGVEPGRGQRLLRLDRKTRLGVDLRRERRDLPLGDVADGLADGLVLLGQGVEPRSVVTHGRDTRTSDYPPDASRSCRVTSRAATCSARSAWKRATAARSAGSPAARMRTASRPALRPPPMETVATGTPAGIWTIDRRLSSPSRRSSGRGTPMTGSGVAAATMPGRCAAPPAPA